MLKRKSEVLQIRLDSELLERIKSASAYHGVHASQFIRGAMDSYCKHIETQQANKAMYLRRQAEKRK